MNAPVVIENVKATELPREWADRLNAPADARFVVRIEPMQTDQAQAAEDETAADSSASRPAFGIWRDREDLAEVERYLRTLRSPRFALTEPRES